MFEDTLPQALGLLTVLIVKAGTGGAMFRSLQAEYLQRAADSLRDPKLTQAAATASALSTEWQALAVNAAAQDLIKATENVKRICDLEHRALRDLEAML
jgi:uncharacterized membrane-anchored protein